MTAIDLKRELALLYRPATMDFELVHVPPLRYLAVDGHGDPNTAPAYAEAVEALYAVAYRTKFCSKAELGYDYVVPPLEGLWWSDTPARFTTARDKQTWDWTMLIMLPDRVTETLWEQARDDVRRKKALPALPRLRLERLDEGLCAQIMHIGSYDDEGPVLARLHDEWLPQHGYRERGKHHEIYLGDPRRVAPQKLKTVLRQPVEPA